MKTEIVVNVELIQQKYLDFKAKEHTEIEKAEAVARKSAAELGWNDVSTQQMVDYVVGTAKAQLASEKAFWDEIVTEKEIEEQVEKDVSSSDTVPDLL